VDLPRVEVAAIDGAQRLGVGLAVGGEDLPIDPAGVVGDHPEPVVGQVEVGALKQARVAQAETVAAVVEGEGGGVVHRMIRSELVDTISPAGRRGRRWRLPAWLPGPRR